MGTMLTGYEEELEWRRDQTAELAATNGVAHPDECSFGQNRSDEDERRDVIRGISAALETNDPILIWDLLEMYR